MLRKTVTYAALAAALSAGSAATAEVHEVTIFDNDLMPPVVYAEPGDYVQFTNDDEGSHVVWSQDETWSTGPIPAGVAVVFMVHEWMSLEYKLDEDQFEDYSEGEGDDPFDGVIEEGIDIADTNANGEFDEGEIYFEAAENNGNSNN
ncbi:cupredoxin domain-containing protein [Vannielia sp. SX4]|uniref:cupredoxin domain-containing protein n=1 Tax=Vannielia sp. SX4 TaxID=3463852 RepID=UPI004057D576